MLEGSTVGVVLVNRSDPSEFVESLVSLLYNGWCFRFELIVEHTWTCPTVGNGRNHAAINLNKNLIANTLLHVILVPDSLTIALHQASRQSLYCQADFASLIFCSGLN